MKQIYIESWKETIVAGHNKRVYGDKVPVGKVFEVSSCFALSNQRATNDRILIGLEDGGQEMVIRSYKPGATQLGLSILNQGAIGEGDRLFAEFLDADNTDVIELHVGGVLYDANAWRKLAG